MRTYARWLFAIAAIANFAVGAMALLAPTSLLAMLQFDPATGTNVAFVYVTGLFIAIFGYSYACVAYDRVTYRAYVSLGAIGKLLFFGTTMSLWLAGIIPSRLPALAG